MSVHTDRPDAGDSVTVPAPDTLAADSRRALAEYQEARAAANAAADALEAAHPDAIRLHREAVELEGAAHVAYVQVLIAEAARHLPAVAPTLRLVLTHVLDGRTDRDDLGGLGEC